MKNAGHYVVGDFKSHASFLGDDEYGRVLDSIVVACSDIILVYNNQILIGMRTRDPQPNWWLIGGRMKPGESFQVAASRNLKRELGLNLSPDRLKYLTTFSAVWARRHHPPTENGIHTISAVMFVNITEEEKRRIRINDEYESIKWVDPSDLVRDDYYHGALRQCASEIVRLLKSGSV